MYLLEIAFPNWNPTILPLFGGLALRWYGLGYVVAFAFTYFMLLRMQKGGYLRLAAEDVGAFLMYAIFGTFLGGRLGYLIFYDDFIGSGRIFTDFFGGFLGVDANGFSGLSGLSFHGGLIGVVLAGSIFVRSRVRRQMRAAGLLPSKSTRNAPADGASAPPQNSATSAENVALSGQRAGFWPRFRASFCDIFDACVTGVPLGIFAVRCANFINGELYGRIVRDESGKPVLAADQAPAWAMRFPTSPEGELALLSYYRDHPDALQGKPLREALHLPVNDSHWQAVMQDVPLRHPSQIYQGLLEGLAVLAIVLFLRTRLPKRGMLAGVFLMGYALARIPMEHFREPDKQFEAGQKLSKWGQVLADAGLTQGQLLSIAMGAAGLAMFFLCARSHNALLLRGSDALHLRAPAMTPAQAGLPARKTR